MVRKTFILVLAMLLSASCLMAATWRWASPYDNVTTYRYQLGSEDGKWTYVDGTVQAVDLDAPAGSTLYVQLSLDGGRNWSPSGTATYEGAPVVREVTVLPASTQTVTTYPVYADFRQQQAEQKSIRKGFGFNFGLGMGTEIIMKGGSSAVNAIGGLNLDFENITGSTGIFALDLLFSVNMYLEPFGGRTILEMFTDPISGMEWYEWDSYAKRYSADATLGFDFRTKVFNLNLGIGGGMAMFEGDAHPVLFSSGDLSFNAYALASASADIYIGSVFHIGAGYKFKYTFDKDDVLKNSEMAHDIVLKLGFTF